MIHISIFPVAIISETKKRIKEYNTIMCCYYIVKCTEVYTKNQKHIYFKLIITHIIKRQTLLFIKKGFF